MGMFGTCEHGATNWYQKWRGLGNTLRKPSENITLLALQLEPLRGKETSVDRSGEIRSRNEENDIKRKQLI